MIDVVEATQHLIDQLNDGQVGRGHCSKLRRSRRSMQGIAAMRFTSKGGVRPEEGFERAAAYWATD